MSLVVAAAAFIAKLTANQHRAALDKPTNAIQKAAAA